MSVFAEIGADWEYYIDPATFRMPKAKSEVPVGCVVLVRSRETDEERTFVNTTFYFATSSGLSPLTKAQASAILVKQMAQYVKEKGHWPPSATVKRARRDGSVDITYSPTHYDSLKLSMTAGLPVAKSRNS